MDGVPCLAPGGGTYVDELNEVSCLMQGGGGLEQKLQ